MATPLALPPRIEQHLYADAATAADGLAAFAAATLRTALAARGTARLLVSGGRSPVRFFAALARQPLDWAAVTVGLVDERCVPSDSADSNARLVREHLLRGAAAAADFVPLYADGAEPEAAAALADARERALPPADLAVLGMGEDGHTASLFPGARGTAAGLDPRGTRRVVATYPETAAHARLSLSLPALLASRTLVLAVQGPAKRAVLERAAGVAVDALPVAAILRQAAAPLHVFYCP